MCRASCFVAVGCGNVLPASRRTPSRVSEKRRCDGVTADATLSCRRCTGASRAAVRRAPAAGRGARAGVCSGPAHAALRAPRARAHPAVRAGAGALPGLPRAARARGSHRARVRARGVRRVPALRRARSRLPARGVPALPCRAAGCLLLQEARLLLELRRTAHGRECAASGGGGVWPAPGAAMGAERSVSLALSVRQQTRRHRPGAGHRAARNAAR